MNCQVDGGRETIRPGPACVSSMSDETVLEAVYLQKVLSKLHVDSRNDAQIFRNRSAA